MRTPTDNLCELLPWDTGFFGCRIARVSGDSLDQPKAEAIEQWCAENSVAGLYFLARSDDPGTTLTAETHGYSLTDIRVTFERVLAPEMPVPVHHGSEAAVRPVHPDDLPILQDIARSSHERTRFSNDPHFAPERVRAFYARWLELECQGRAEKVFVAVSPNQDPVGYISCHRSGSSAEIGLVGVAPGYRGNGLGYKLVLSALSWFEGEHAKDVTVVTQGSNKAAQRLYQRCGFLTKSVQLWYHKWCPKTGR